MNPTDQIAEPNYHEELLLLQQLEETMEPDRIEEGNRLLDEYYQSKEYEQDREAFEEWEFFETLRRPLAASA